MITYQKSAESLRAEQLAGFFVDWPVAPTPEQHLALLQGSSHVVLAIDSESDRVIGFVTAVSDGVLSAYVPLLEVLPDYQGAGIGSQLMQRIIEDLGELYMIDLQCDAELQPFYDRLGMQRSVGMSVRNRPE